MPIEKHGHGLGACHKCWGPNEFPLSTNLQWHLLVTNQRCSCSQTLWACLLPTWKRFIFISQLSIIKVHHSGFVHASAGSWALFSPAYLQTTDLPFLSSVLFWITREGIRQCVHLTCVGIGTSSLLSPRAMSIRSVWHGPFMDHSYTSTLTVLLSYRPRVTLKLQSSAPGT